MLKDKLQARILFSMLQKRVTSNIMFSTSIKCPCLHFQVNEPAEYQISNNYVNMDCQKYSRTISLQVQQMKCNTKFNYFTNYFHMWFLIICLLVLYNTTVWSTLILVVYDKEHSIVEWMLNMTEQLQLNLKWFWSSPRNKQLLANDVWTSSPELIQ